MSGEPGAGYAGQPFPARTLRRGRREAGPGPSRECPGRSPLRATETAAEAQPLRGPAPPGRRRCHRQLPPPGMSCPARPPPDPAPAGAALWQHGLLRLSRHRPQSQNQPGDQICSKLAAALRLASPDQEVTVGTAALPGPPGPWLHHRLTGNCPGTRIVSFSSLASSPNE
ncbi:unnamed protein product [Coccothraustes coccothraustes]